MAKKNTKKYVIDEKIVAEYHKLIDEIAKYDFSYYNLNSPTTSDSKYDTKYYQLQKIEECYPSIIVPYSPTQRVGGVVSSEFKKVKHASPMLSLDKRNDIDLIGKDFIKKNKLSSTEIIAEHKLDGLTLVITYKNGLLNKAVTRGNGTEGEDVTHTARTIKNLPLIIPHNGLLVIRGEVFITHKDFDAINSKLAKEGLKTYSTTRNLASGSLRQLDPAISYDRNLLFQAYDVVETDAVFSDKLITELTDDVCLMWLNEYQNIPTVDFTIVKGMKEIRSYLKKLETSRNKGLIKYDIDGAVLKINDLLIREKLGNGTRYPYWAIAFKFEDDTYETTLKDVVMQVSRTRRINPVAIISPVNIDGTVVERATLNNFDFMRGLYLGIGDTITVRKANEVIPNIVENITCSNSFKIPDKCPECGSQVTKKGAYLYCNNKYCIGAQLSIIRHFASRSGMDIRGLSYSKIYDLLDNGFIKDVADLYEIKKYKKQIIELDGWGYKSYLNLYNAIDKSRSVYMENFLYALGIPLLGYQSACALCEYVNWDLNDIFEMSIGDFEEVPDFGHKTSRIVYNGFRSPFVIDTIKKLVYGGVIEFIENEEFEPMSEKLVGYTIAITGTLSKTRDELVKIIQSHGGTFSDGIKKNTTHLLAGAKAGSKLSRAREKGLIILTEEEFDKLLEY